MLVPSVRTWLGAGGLAVALGACTAGASPERERPDVVTGAAVDPLRAFRTMPGSAHVDGETSSSLDGETSTRSWEAEVRFDLDFATDELVVIAIDDPIGTARIEERAGRFALVVDGLRVPLLDQTLGQREVTVAALSADSADGPRFARQAIEEKDGCVEATVVLGWDASGALSATERSESYRFCPGVGLTARSRTTVFPLGVRTLSWTRR